MSSKMRAAPAGLSPLLLFLFLASAALAIQKPTPGACALEGVLVRHARIGRVGVLFDVATPFEAFLPAELAPGAGRGAPTVRGLLGPATQGRFGARASNEATRVESSRAASNSRSHFKT